MKRFHVSVGVDDLDRSIRFYTNLFGAEPAVHETDYAKWMLDEPRINFAISSRGDARGVDHLGIQVEEPDELEAITARLQAAEEELLTQEGTVCCYARSDKTWAQDPEGVRWETFRSFGRETVYGVGPFEEDQPAEPAPQAAPPAPETAPRCC